MRKNIHIPDDVVADIETYRHESRLKSETSAVVDLISVGLDSISKRRGYVYLVRDVGSGAVKIGYSQSPKDRVAQISSTEGITAELIGCFSGTMADERALHKEFAPLRLRGEWFSDDDRQILSSFKNHEEFIDGCDVKSKIKEIRIKCSEELYDAADLGAKRLEMAMTAYVRMALLERMARDGMHPEQPKADHA